MTSATGTDTTSVSWEVAEQVARRLMRTAPIIDRPTLQRLDDDFAKATERAEVLVEEVTGLHSTSGPARISVTDRAGWVHGNVGSFRRLLAPFGDRFSEDGEGALRAPGPAGKAIAGAEVGAVLAWMSGRVLGQYDPLPYIEDVGGDVLYYVGTNIVSLERRHGFPPHEFRLWIAVHELTHRAQFTGVPWMHDYFFSLIDRGVRFATPDTKVASDTLSRVLEEVRQGRNPLAEGGIMTIIASPEQRTLLHEIQAFMSLLEGHGNYVMNRAGASEILGARRFARVLEERRKKVRGISKIFQQALGMEAKLRQYSQGEDFVSAVARIGGDELLAKVWTSPDALPTLEEIHTPAMWAERVGGSSLTRG